MPGQKKNELYKDFVKKGGGEAAKLPGSKTLAEQGDRANHEIEKRYRDELFAFYRRYGKTEMKAAIDSEEALRSGAVLFDGKHDAAARDLYNYQDTLVQASFDKPTRISRLDIHWRRGVPDRFVRLELQTSSALPECWYSVVNDERLWEPSVARVGSTLLGARLPGEERVTTLWFPEREAKAVRLLLTSFPSEATEFVFYGR